MLLTTLINFGQIKGNHFHCIKTEQYFTPDTTLIINGKRVYQGYAEFTAHFKAVGKNIPGHIDFPLLKLMSLNRNLIVAQFNEDIIDNDGNHYPTHVVAFFTLYQGKIQHWEEVVDSSYFCRATATQVVYSY